MTFAVETKDLTKRYGDILAVDGMSLTVRQGEVYGFLGPNGAGKTTTLRMLLDLVRPTSGQVRLFGRPPGDLSDVGALIESPGFYPYLSGRDNLKVLARYAGVGVARIARVLDTVDLTDRGGHRYGAYSLGMKQRLGVAAALLKDPRLLILDEPTNGLDPAGMADMRVLIRQLGAAGCTVLLSSHMLGEVQQICDRVAIVNLGQLARVARLPELVSGQGEFAVSIEDPRPALHAVITQDWGRGARAERDQLITTSPTGRGRDLVRFLASQGLWPTAIAERQPTLEDIFLDLTSRPQEAAQ